MDPSRRSLLIGACSAWLVPGPVGAQPALPDREHHPRIEVPALSEDPTAVPVRIWVEHPMEPDHFVRSLDVRLDRDPVPHKGTFLFSPANGQASVAFQMRSGVGGTLRVTAECTRHGRFEGRRDLRVSEGGCTTAPDAADREGAGNPRLRLSGATRPGDVVQVRAKIDHASHTGLVMRDGRIVRQAPAYYVREMLVFLDDEQVSEFRLTPAVSANPLIRFPVRPTRPGRLRVVFVNSEGRRWEVSQPIRF